MDHRQRELAGEVGLVVRIVVLIRIIVAAAAATASAAAAASSSSWPATLLLLVGSRVQEAIHQLALGARHSTASLLALILQVSHLQLHQLSPAVITAVAAVAATSAISLCDLRRVSGWGVARRTHPTTAPGSTTYFSQGELWTKHTAPAV